jgi:hypothetical protein
MGFDLAPIKIVLGIGKYDLSQCISLKQGYIDTLKVNVSFIGKDGKQFIIPSGSTAKIRMIKPDKHKVLDDTENNGEVTGNTVTFKITNQMQAYPGDGALEIILFNSGKTVTSSTCGIRILENVHDDSGIESTDEWLTVLNTLAELEEKIQDATTATNNANSAADELRRETLIVYLPDITNYSAIATTYPNPQIGWATVAEDTHIRWRWNGTEWKNIGTVQNIGVASNTTPGTVKGGGNVTISVDGLMNVDLSEKLDKTGDAKDNIVTFTDATADVALTSGSKLSVLIGLIKFKLSSILTSLAGKIDKISIVNTDTVNDTTKVLGANVGYALGQEIDSLNEKLVNYTKLSGAEHPVGIWTDGRTMYSKTFFFGAMENGAESFVPIDAGTTAYLHICPSDSMLFYASGVGSLPISFYSSPTDYCNTWIYNGNLYIKAYNSSGIYAAVVTVEYVK